MALRMACSAALIGIAALVPAGAVLGNDLATLILKQTEAFSAAGKAGDRTAFERLLDDRVVFTNEDGSMPSKGEMIEGLVATPGKFTLKVTKFRLIPQGDVATATFVDVLKQDFFGHQIQTDFRSTEVWAERPDGWRMIASQTMVVPREPEAIALTAREASSYVGEYSAGAELKVTVRMDGERLLASLNGGAPRQLIPSSRDVFFVAGMPGLRRYFLRDDAGSVVTYLMSINGNDIALRRHTRQS